MARKTQYDQKLGVWAKAPTALCALVRLLAKQAAREVGHTAYLEDKPHPESPFSPSTRVPPDTGEFGTADCSPTSRAMPCKHQADRAEEYQRSAAQIQLGDEGCHGSPESRPTNAQLASLPTDEAAQ